MGGGNTQQRYDPRQRFTKDGGGGGTDGGYPAGATPNGPQPTTGAQAGGPVATPGMYTPWQSSGFIGTPYLQTYGGAPNDYADDGAQILDSWRMTQTGAGRFGANNASRFAWNGGGSYWMPDTMGYGAAPASPYGARSPLPRPPRPEPRPTSLASPAVPGGPGGIGAGSPAGGVDHWANFQTLQRENPALAREYAGRAQYTDASGARKNLMQGRQADITAMLPSGQAYADWAQGGSAGMAGTGGAISDVDWKRLMAMGVNG